jgi:pyruvate dehydrogenase E2 component (dihydrolipoamide acetyltransferase)
MPSLGMYTAEGALTAWLRPDGATVAAGEPVAEITTEKASYEIEAPGDGTLHAVAAVGATLPVQGILGYVLAPGEAPPTPAGGGGGEAGERGSGGAGERGGGEAGAIPSPRPSPMGRGSAAASASPHPPSEIRASPVARRLAAQHGVELAGLTGSGPGGRIVEADVLAAIARPAATGGDKAAEGRRVRQRLPLAGMRRTIAERLRHSLSTTASVTLTREVDAEAFVAARGRLGERLGRAVPFDALFVKLFAVALRERPELNAVVEPDAIALLDEIHVGFAVSVPGGLVVPVVRDADARPLGTIVAEMTELAERARAGHPPPADLAGGTATITNLGAHGVDAFTPILNPPQAVILGIGRIRPRPALEASGWVARQSCILSLTFDHRVADGAPAAELLAVVARLMADEAYLDDLA